MSAPLPSPLAARPVHIIGASGRSGAALTRALLTDGTAVIPVVRNIGKWRSLGFPPACRVAELSDTAALAAALHDAAAIVSCAHARHTPAIIATAPASATLVLLGSTRKFTSWPDAHGNGVLAGEAAFLASGRDGVMLHPPMIYGAQGEDNVRRLAALLRRVWLLPLPGGGKALVQPIHQSDVTAALRAALKRDWSGPHSLVIAGPTAIRYAEFVRAVAAADGQRRPRILPFPAGPLIAAASLPRLIPGMPVIRAGEIRRLLEDKAFDIAPMREALGIEPMSLQDGLARTFGPPHDD
jgi:uncharacterized protein YbjT (DUF2867 family)